MACVWPEQWCEALVPVVNGEVGVVDELGYLAVGLAGMVQEHTEHPLLDDGPDAAKYLLLVWLLDNVVEQRWRSHASSTRSLALISTP